MAEKKDYARQVAETLVAQLEQGVAPWTKPWLPGERFMPYNPTSGAEYHGMNAIWLMAVAQGEGYADARWLTYRQAQGADAQVRKGEKGTVVQYWKWSGEELVEGPDGQQRKELVRYERPRVFSAVVFNASQVERATAAFVAARPSRVGAPRAGRGHPQASRRDDPPSAGRRRLLRPAQRSDHAARAKPVCQRRSVL